MVSNKPTAFLCVGNLFMVVAQRELPPGRRPPQMAIADTFPGQGKGLSGALEWLGLFLFL